jgi:cytochrome oxidase assembly protein ShyY1
MVSSFGRKLLVVLIGILCLTALGLARWQWQRHLVRTDSNSRLLAAGTLPPISLGTETAPDGATMFGRTVIATGAFLPDSQLVLRGRVHQSAPGVHVVTPFRLESGAAIWVLRGFVHAPDALKPSVPIAGPASGQLSISGLMMPLPVTTDRGQPVASSSGDTTWRRLDREMALERLPGALDGYLILTGGEQGPGQLPSAEPPTLDAGPHFSYAIQWVCIAIAIAAFGFIALRRRDPSRAQPVVAP